MRSAIVERPLDAAALQREVGASSNGATVIFVGSVRDLNDGRDVTALDYRAYVPMAERELAAIVSDAEERWSPAAIVCEHRVGTLAIGEASVVVAAAHAHRHEAFAACQFVVEELKRRVPIWKREHYADGTLSWVENSGSGGRSELQAGIAE